MTTTRNVSIPIESGASIAGGLVIPDEAVGVVIFCHGSGSSRLIPRNLAVADRLRRSRLATLLIDLLTEEEDTEDRGSGRYRFDIELLAQRLARAAGWSADSPDLAELPY